MKKTIKVLPTESSAATKATENKATTGESMPALAKQPARPYQMKFVDGKPLPDYDTSTPDGFAKMLIACRQASGHNDMNAGHNFIFQTISSLGITLEEKNLRTINGIIATLSQLSPKDALDGMLLSQMLAVHNAAQLNMQNALEARTPELMEKYINSATKLHRTYTAQLQAYEQRKRGGNQKITIEHVTVNAGGQAIVGNVAGAGGTGGNGK